MIISHFNSFNICFLVNGVFLLLFNNGNKVKQLTTQNTILENLRLKKREIFSKRYPKKNAWYNPKEKFVFTEIL